MAQQVDYDYQPENGGGKFINLKSKGDKVTMRLVDKPISYFVHWVEDKKPLVCDEPKDCEVCKFLDGLTSEELKLKANSQKRRRQTFIWSVIDRADGEAKLFKGGLNVFLAIGEFAKDPNWGGEEKDATLFDVTITRTETSLANYYSVVPDPKSLSNNLTAEQKKAAAKLGPLIDAISTGEAAEDISADVNPASEKKADEEEDTSDLPF